MPSRLILLFSLLSAITAAHGQRFLTEPELVSRYTADVPGALGSRLMSVSGNSRFVVFWSRDSLVPEDTTGEQVYVRDLRSGELELISVTPDGNVSAETQPQPEPRANGRYISDDGRYVAFASSASDLVPSASPPAGVIQVYVRDRLLGETVLATVDDDGVPANGNTVDFTLDPSGVAVMFRSQGDNLDPMVPVGDRNYLHRLDAVPGSSERTRVACPNASGDPVSGSSCRQWSLSCGGAIMAFVGTGASQFIAEDGNVLYNDVFVGNTIDGNYVRLGAEADTPIGPAGAFGHGGPAINCEGNRVAVLTTYPLTNGDDFDPDLYVYQLISRQNFLIERTPGESLVDNVVPGLSLSSGGGVVTFLTRLSLNTNDTNALDDAYAVYLPINPQPPYEVDWVSTFNGVAPDAPVDNVSAGSTGVIAFSTDADNGPWEGASIDGQVYVNSVPSEIISRLGFESP